MDDKSLELGSVRIHVARGGADALVYVRPDRCLSDARELARVIGDDAWVVIRTDFARWKCRSIVAQESFR